MKMVEYKIARRKKNKKKHQDFMVGSALKIAEEQKSLKVKSSSCELKKTNSYLYFLIPPVSFCSSKRNFKQVTFKMSIFPQNRILV